MRKTIRIEFCMMPEEVERFHLKTFQRRMAKELTPQIARKIILNPELINRPDFWELIDLSVGKCDLFVLPNSTQKAVVMTVRITKAGSAYVLARGKVIWRADGMEYPWMDEKGSQFGFYISDSEKSRLWRELPRIVPRRLTADQTGLPFELLIYNSDFSDGQLNLCMKEFVEEEQLCILRKNIDDFLQSEAQSYQRNEIETPIHSVCIKSRKPTTKVVMNFDLGGAGYEGLLRLLKAFSVLCLKIDKCVIR